MITKLPLINLFSEISSLIALEFFDRGLSIMNNVIEQIQQWPSPMPGQIINLPLLDVMIQARHFDFTKNINLNKQKNKF